ncbi:MAG: class I SAM-dependent methyltransferase [Geobacteraceae bacterium]|nr:class I SAM-dependent methyltransferase [Geobacteraceae bacterium]
MNLIEYARMYEVEDRHWWYVALHALILATTKRESRRIGRTLAVFDAGCGTGRLCQLMAAQGHAVAGCDASELALQHCHQRGVSTVCQADLNTLELESEAFDVVTAIDVLYHTGIVDDVAVMKRLWSSLRPGGMLILNLVAHEFLRSTHDIAVHTRERYDRNMLCERLQAAGFDTVFATYRVSFLFPLIAVYRLVSRFVSVKETDRGSVASDVSLPHPLTNSLLLKIMTVENLLIKNYSLPFGSSIFVLARKQ